MITTIRVFDIQIIAEDGSAIAIIPDRSGAGEDEVESFDNPKRRMVDYDTSLEKALNWFEEKGWQIISIIERALKEMEKTDSDLIKEYEGYLKYYHVVARKS